MRHIAVVIDELIILGNNVKRFVLTARGDSSPEQTLSMIFDDASVHISIPAVVKIYELVGLELPSHSLYSQMHGLVRDSHLFLKK